MSYTITLLVNTCYPRQPEEGKELPTHSLNEQGALITDVVVGILTLAAGALALVAGHCHLGPLSFLGNLSQAWAISLISAGGGVILLELTVFAIKSCKNDTPEAPSGLKAGRPRLNTPVKREPSGNGPSGGEVKTPTAPPPTPPRNPDGSPLIQDPRNLLPPPPDVSNLAFIPFDPNAREKPLLPAPPKDAELNLNPASGPNPILPPFPVYDTTNAVSGKPFGSLPPPPNVPENPLRIDLPAPPNAEPLSPPIAGSAVDNQPPLPPFPSTVEPGAVIPELAKLLETLPPPPLLDQKNIEELNTSFIGFVEQQRKADSHHIPKQRPAVNAPKMEQSPIVSTSLTNIQNRLAVHEAMDYVHEYFDMKAQAETIEPSGGMQASILTAVTDQIEEATLPEWFKTRLLTLRTFMYEGATQDDRRERLAAIKTSLNELEGLIANATRVANPVVDPEVAEKARAALEEKQRAEALKAQATTCEEARYHRYYAGEVHDLTTLNLKSLSKIQKQTLKTNARIDLKKGAQDIKELTTLLEAVQEDKLLSHTALQAIVEKGKVVRHFADTLREACVKSFISKEKAFDKLYTIIEKKEETIQ